MSNPSLQKTDLKLKPGSKLFQKEFWQFYCPICKTERRTFYWPSPRKRHIVQVVGGAIALSMILWTFLGFKGVFLGFPLFAAFDFFYRLRARQSLICPHCGFDPYLYKFNADLAKKKVEEFFVEKEKKIQASKKQNTTGSPAGDPEKKETVS